MTFRRLYQTVNEAITIKPGEFWSYTPNEVRDMVTGAQMREEREWERTAWQTAHLMNIAGKTARKKITPDQLLGRNRNDPSRNLNTVWQRVKRRRNEEAEQASA